MKDLELLFWFHASKNQFTKEEAEQNVIEQIQLGMIDYRMTIIKLIDLLYDSDRIWLEFAVKHDFLDEQICKEIGEENTRKYITEMFKYLDPFSYEMALNI